MTRPLAILDLFSGVGAYSLGLERTGGFKTIAFCEIEEYPRRILRKHWPDVPIFDDVRTITGAGLRERGIVPDWIVGGWPCQGNSLAGTGLGMDDPRSGLWSEIARLAGEIRPQGLLLENSSNLLNVNGGRDFGRVLGDLASVGYDAEWHCLPAAAFDALHIRDRVWIIATRADASCIRCDPFWVASDGQQGRLGVGVLRSERSLADPTWNEPGRREQRAIGVRVGEGCESVIVANPQRDRRPGSRINRDAGHLPANREREANRPEHGRQDMALSHSLAPIGTAIARQQRHTWEPEPDVGRVATGVANRVERIHALGNLNPPIIPERGTASV